MKKMILFLYFSFLFFSYKAGVCESASRLEECVTNSHSASQNLKSLPVVDRDWNTDSFSEFITRTLEMQENPSDEEKRRIGFKILEELQPFTGDLFTASSSVIDEKTLSELELVLGKKNSTSYVAAKLDRTTTEIGRCYLFSLLSLPTDDVAVLRKRQNLIHYLADNPKLLSELRDALQAFGDCEKVLATFWKNDPFKMAARRSYFSGSFLDGLNKNDITLECKNRFDHYQRFLWGGSNFIAIVLALFSGAVLVSGTVPFVSSESVTSLADEHRLRTPFFGYSKRFSPAMQGFLRISAAFYESLFLKGSAEWCYDNFVLDRCLHQKMMHVAGAFKSFGLISQNVEHDTTMQNLFPTMTTTREIMKKELATNKLLKTLVDTLKAKTFSGQPSVFSRAGKVFLAFKLMHELKDSFNSIFACVGQLDAFVSLASLYNEFRNKEVGFSFAQYDVTEKAPSLNLEGFWHPLIDPQMVVTNNLILGGQQKRNGIVTGPNAGGKSTLLKSVAVALLCAQTIGIVPAKSCILTPFSKIRTNFDVVDDLSGGNSLFKSEVVQAHNLIEVLKNNPREKFCFCAIDEMCRGTSPEEGAALSYALAEHIGAFDSTLSLIATHFPILTSLAEKTPYFDVYKVSVTRHDDGRISYPFKLQAGISHQHVALDMVKNEGLGGAIVDRAQSLIVPNEGIISASTTEVLL